MHEAALYPANCFLTLTYGDDWLPPDGSLRRRDFQLFMKRLRRYLDGSVVRYYQCGEYGDRFGRPHYHSLLFGYDFPDKIPWSVRSGRPVWRSRALEALWPFGLSEIGSVTYESAAYVARYVMKKVRGDPAAVEAAYGGREPPYSTMSRKPGIGKAWLDKFGCEVYPSDGIVMRGKLMKPPRFYDGQFELVDPVVVARVKRARKRARNPLEETDERLLVRSAVVGASLSLRKGRDP